MAVLVFAFAITAMGLTMVQPMNHQFEDVGIAMNTLAQMSLGIMDLSELHDISEENPVLLVMLGVFMVVVSWWQLTNSTLVHLFRGPGVPSQLG